MRISWLFLVFAALLLGACGGSAPESSSPADAYTAFFERLDNGDRQQALESLAPEGALGDTFRGGSYYMMAEVMEQQYERHGGLDAVLIDEEREISSEEVHVEGRVRYGDGMEEPRRIIFVKEGERWVGRL
jgi:hypothetical protein